MEGPKVVRNKLKKQVTELAFPKATKLKKEISSVRHRLRLLFNESRKVTKTEKKPSSTELQRASSMSRLLYPIKHIPDVRTSESLSPPLETEPASGNYPTSIQEIWLNHQPDDIYSGSNCSVAYFSICGDADDTHTNYNEAQKRFCHDLRDWNSELDSQTALGSRKETYGSEESYSDLSIGETYSDSDTGLAKRKSHRTQASLCTNNNSGKQTNGSKISNRSSPIHVNKRTHSLGRNGREARSTSALFGKRTLMDMHEPLQICTYRSPVKKKAVHRKLHTFVKQTDSASLSDVKTLAVV